MVFDTNQCGKIFDPMIQNILLPQIGLAQEYLCCVLILCTDIVYWCYELILCTDIVYWCCGQIRCTDTVYWHCVLVLCTGNVYWYCVLILCTHTLYWYCVLILCTDTVNWYCVLILCTDTVYWYCVLILCNETLYWYCVLILCTNTVYWYCVLLLCTATVYCTDTVRSDNDKNGQIKIWLKNVIWKRFGVRNCNGFWYQPVWQNLWSHDPKYDTTSDWLGPRILMLCIDTVYWYCVLILYTVNDVQKALETIGFDVFVSIPNTKKWIFHWKYECFENNEEQPCAPQQWKH